MPVIRVHPHPNPPPTPPTRAPQTAHAAIDWFGGKPFGDRGKYPGSRLEVSIARRPAAEKFGKGGGKGGGKGRF